MELALVQASVPLFTAIAIIIFCLSCGADNEWVHECVCVLNIKTPLIRCAHLPGVPQWAHIQLGIAGAKWNCDL